MYTCAPNRPSCFHGCRLGFRKLESDITKLVRHIAVQEAKKTKQGPVAEEEKKILSDGLNEEP